MLCLEAVFTWQECCFIYFYLGFGGKLMDIWETKASLPCCCPGDGHLQTPEVLLVHMGCWLREGASRDHPHASPGVSSVSHQKPGVSSLEVNQPPLSFSWFYWDIIVIRRLLWTLKGLTFKALLCHSQVCHSGTGLGFVDPSYVFLFWHPPSLGLFLRQCQKTLCPKIMISFSAKKLNFFSKMCLNIAKK